MEGLRELRDVLNWREICFETSPSSWKSITEMPIPSSEKVGGGILVIDFQANLFMSSEWFQNLQSEFIFNLRRPSTLYDLPFQSYVDKRQDWFQSNRDCWFSMEPNRTRSWLQWTTTVRWANSIKYPINWPLQKWCDHYLKYLVL
jgi:hypothetical protein